MPPELPHLYQEATHIDGRGGNADGVALYRLVQLDGLLDAVATPVDGQGDPAFHQVLEVSVGAAECEVRLHAVWGEGEEGEGVMYMWEYRACVQGV